MSNNFFKAVLVASTLLLPVSGISQNSDNFSFESQLVDAAENNNASIIKLLLQQGSNPNERGRFETTALHRAAYNGFGNIVDILIASGADLDAQDFGGATPLHIVARQGNKQIIEKLVSAGANINKKDNEGYTPLHRAVSSAKTDAVRTLLSLGASVNTKVASGETPLMDAARSNNSDLVQILSSVGGNSLASAAGSEIRPNISRNLLTNSSALISPKIGNTNIIELQPQNKIVPTANVEEYSDELIAPSNATFDTEIKTIQLSGEQNNIEIPAIILPNSERARISGVQNQQASSSATFRLEEELLSNENQIQERQIQRTKVQEIQSTDNQVNSDFLIEEIARENRAISQATPKVDNIFEENEIQNNNFVKSDEFLPNEFNSVASGVPASFAFRNVARANQPEDVVLARKAVQNVKTNSVLSSSYNQLNYQKYKSSELFTTPVDSIQVVRLDGNEFKKDRVYTENIQSNKFNNYKEASDYSGGLIKKSYEGIAGLPKSLMPKNERIYAQVARNNSAPNNFASQDNFLKGGSQYNQMKAVPVSNVEIVGDDELMQNAAINANNNWQTPAKSWKNPDENQLISNNSTTDQIDELLNQNQPLEIQNLEDRRPVPSSMKGSRTINLVDNGAYDILNDQASGDTLIPAEYSNVSKTNNLQPDKLASNINTFYNQDGSYDVSYDLSGLEAERANNLVGNTTDNNIYNNKNIPNNNAYVENIAVPKSMGNKPVGRAYNSNNYDSFAGGIDSSTSEYPRVEGNYARGPKSIQFWRSIPQNRKAQVYSRIIQQNSPIITPERQRNIVNKAITKKDYSDSINISMEPQDNSENLAFDKPLDAQLDKPVAEEQNWNTEVTVAENAKVPSVAVEEEKMEELPIPEVENKDFAQSNLPAQIQPEKENLELPAQPNMEVPNLENSDGLAQSEETKIPAAPDQELPNIDSIPEPTLPDEIVSLEQQIQEQPKIEEPKISEPSISEPTLSNQNSNFQNATDYTEAALDNDLTGTHAVIGTFNSNEEAIDYFNKISLRLGLLYNYKVAKSSSSNKFSLAVGKFDDEESANKVCEVYSSSEATCQVYLNQTYDSENLRDLQLVDSKKVYSMIGEFPNEEASREFFRSHSSKFKVDYKVAQNPDGNIYLLQVGPLFNGGDGKNICDEMKAPDIKCRVTLK